MFFINILGVQVSRQAATSAEIEVEIQSIEEMRKDLVDLSAGQCKSALQVLRAEEPKMPDSVAIVLMKELHAWTVDSEKIPEEIALVVMENHSVEVVAWQVRALLFVLNIKKSSDKGRMELRKRAEEQKRQQKRAIDLCKAMPQKVVDCMTCNECCNGLVSSRPAIAGSLHCQADLSV